MVIHRGPPNPRPNPLPRPKNDKIDPIQISCIQIHKVIDHSLNRIDQLIDNLEEVTNKKTSFDRRTVLTNKIENHLNTIKSNMDRALLLL